MNLKAIFGATFFSVLAALVIMQLFGNDALAKVKQGYDGTSNFSGGKNADGADLIGRDADGNEYYAKDEKVFRVRNSRRVAA